MAQPSPRAIRFDERLSDADRLMWNLESDPSLRSTILSTALLDRLPDMERFEAKLEQAARTIPRLRQRVVDDPLGIAPPSWEDDPGFDLGFHLRRVRVPEPGGERELLDLAAPIAMQAFDKDRPLWELHVVEGLEGGRAAVIMKLHHAISDGVGLVKMTECLIERGPDDPGREMPVDDRSKARTDTPTPWSRAADALAHRLRGGLARGRAIGDGLWRAAPDLLRSPLEKLSDVRDVLESIARALEPAREPMSPLMTGRSGSVRLDYLPIPLDDLKRAGKAVHGSVNDAFVAGVAGGLARYHEMLGQPTEGLRMLMPINVRSEEKSHVAGNHFAPARFEVPLGISNPGERIREIGRLCRVQRDEPALPWMEEVSGVLGALPPFAVEALVGAMQKTTDFTTSNVPGPRRATWMSGAQVEAFMPFGPRAGAGANFTVFSYQGVMHLGINTDPAAVSDPELLVECLGKSFAEVTSLAA